MSKPMTVLPDVKEQYEDYPYPPRDPEAEKQRLMVTSISRMDVISHHCYGGQQDFNDFEVLVAGAGTGDSALFWAEQLRDKKGGRVIYFDMSAASMEIAKQRAAMRQLDNIAWVQGSILDLSDLGLGQFDFIDCCGVLHHLADPDEGLRALRSVLKPDGVIGIMVYATHGRTSVYHMQELMRFVNDHEDSKSEKILNTKKVIDSLPAQNWFKVSQEHIVHMGDVVDDAGLYDLLLHSQDRSYTITEIYDWLSRCDLHMLAAPGMGTLEHAFYRPENFVHDLDLLEIIQDKPIAVQQAIAENICGRIIKHHFFCGHPSRITPDIDLQNSWSMIPYAGLHGLSPFADIATNLAKNPDNSVEITSEKYDDMVVASVRGGKIAAAILCLIDGKRSIEDIFNVVCTLPDIGDAPSREQYMTVCSALVEALNPPNFLFLRHPDTPAYMHFSIYEQRVRDLY